MQPKKEVKPTKAVEPIKEKVKPKKQMEEQQKQIDELKAMIGGNAAINVLMNDASLEQNIPNPFNHSTTIKYTLPQKFTTAQIVITDKNGKTIKQLNISGNFRLISNKAVTEKIVAYQNDIDNYKNVNGYDAYEARAIYGPQSKLFDARAWIEAGVFHRRRLGRFGQPSAVHGAQRGHAIVPGHHG